MWHFKPLSSNCCHIPRAKWQHSVDWPPESSLFSGTCLQHSLTIIYILSHRSCHSKLWRYPALPETVFRRRYPKRVLHVALFGSTFLLTSGSCSSACVGSIPLCSNWLVVQSLGPVLGNRPRLLTHVTWSTSSVFSFVFQHWTSTGFLTGGLWLFPLNLP